MKFANRYVLLDKETYDRVTSATTKTKNTSIAVAHDDPIHLTDRPYGDVQRELADMRAVVDSKPFVAESFSDKAVDYGQCI